MICKNPSLLPFTCCCCNTRRIYSVSDEDDQGTSTSRFNLNLFRRRSQQIAPGVRVRDSRSHRRLYIDPALLRRNNLNNEPAEAEATV